ncbi:MAG TPA: HAMP domain-containing sensor histidine kinase [Candidatus Sumerlaeota bacterium]|nr:MAG: Sensor protein ZraS [candidate division BRC1 bacterium ADurb.BinA292]HOE96653.1 HAMP domain-containing sensor histidine kinase [Candidatus Sumerlaeota bacterium]HOR27890.1 HAMP domain-containing sensor histidine kinase [Candidatus Sumerlaeota bacterium]HPK01029.1 HAMP domain-containing sensor histidine kinase [Candidatus Sumerlaeota bacterium]
MGAIRWPPRSTLRGGLLPANRPLRLAAVLALSYLAVCALYIRVSTTLAARFAESLVELERLEQLKGLAFIVVSSLVFFGIAYYLLRRISLGELEIERNRQALLTAGRRALAGALASSIAHDMNNLLMVTDVDSLELARGALQGPETPEQVGARVNGCVRDLMKLSRRLMTIGSDRSQYRPRGLDLAACVRDTLEFARIHKRVRRCALEYAGPEVLGFVSDPVALQQMLLNLLLNAADAMGGEGRILVELKERAPGVVLRVHDSGPGIPPDKRQAIFDAFYTSKESGAGLGLLSVRSCAELHGGRIHVGESARLGGALFEIELPPCQAVGIEQDQ